MSNVTHIDDARRHLSFPVMCHKCWYEWVAVFPVETKSLECPGCHEAVPLREEKDDANN